MAETGPKRQGMLFFEGGRKRAIQHPLNSDIVAVPMEGKEGEGSAKNGGGETQTSSL